MRDARYRWLAPSADSLLGRLRARGTRHPDEFDCAVRVVEGNLPGESGRWRYRRSAVDPLVLDDGVVTLQHGSRNPLRLRFTGEQRPGTAPLRLHHVIWPAAEVTSGASVEVAADAGEGGRWRLD